MQGDKPSREEAPGRGRGPAAQKGYEQAQQAAIDVLRAGQVTGQERDEVITGVLEAQGARILALEAAVFPEDQEV